MNYLLEIGLEEVPAHLVTPSINQLEERMSAFLTEHRVSFDRIVKFSTPRRLTLLVEGLAEQSASSDEEVKGPSAKIAKDKEGNWSKAIQGFSRGQGVNPDDLLLKGDYYYAEKHIEGVATSSILTAVSRDVIEKMQFSTYMKWANNSFLFVRPIQWLVSLLDNEVVPFSLLDVTAGNQSRGHRFLDHDATFTIETAEDYLSAMTAHFVMADSEARKAAISEQILTLAAEHNWDVILHEGLLEEVNNIVEYPTAFVGSFDEKYLEVPAEVLVTSMRDNQRYFEVYTKDGKLAPHFISVRNGNGEHMEKVIEGNEKVLVARLEDAEFFWNEDQKLKLEDLVEKLSKVTFHAKIGSITEHMARTKAVGHKLADLIGASATEKADLARASEIYKFDLLTGMVGEFDELQGVMGEKYARLAGENEAVSAAIREHYMPTSADGELPATKVGSLLAASDKLDSLMSFFNAGLIPSGSNDPYALRRAAQGLIRIIEKMNWRFDFVQFIDQFDFENKAELREFMKARIQKLLLEDGVRYDIVDAVVEAQPIDLAAIMEAAHVISAHQEHAPFKPAVENVARVINLAKKVETSQPVDASLMENEAETGLYETVENLKLEWDGLETEMKFRSIVHQLAPAISTFFENVMVMVDDEKVKNNRLSLLTEVVTMTNQLGDFTKIITK
ncbi:MULTISPECIES: glycine--tRNA ligase subunit beta [unclassified Lactococcus]|uniref:glycine--tRNA ligase subunit beta n=1 Tax=unclassified Lactococcus TaxID=2643510 RepID=UPI0011CA9DD7|nr:MULTISPECIES: glycine--tRNA ligase subunit beta [unclassified Lactococcus]MQW23113.1 glycine--tRNA ligase subunit beta [Lactococcus sp. dk101]TXK44167.1 glycine--tRNA ligase subunit beta [Lactococcus sp. dk310]TXK49898.1 glycine--tRNA ligase subunit beta [Lactococcus sp. dk322]